MEYISGSLAVSANFFNDNQGVINASLLLVCLLTFCYVIRQIHIQRMAYHSQILKDRIEMYWKTKEPITDIHIDNVKCFP